MLRRQAIHLAKSRPLSLRSQHRARSDVSNTPNPYSPDVADETDLDAGAPQLTGSAKLFSDAVEEETAGIESSSRKHLVQNQGPIWTGDEEMQDGVLRMLIDAHKPLRTGQGVKHSSADDKIKGWMKNLKLEPRLGKVPDQDESSSTSSTTASEETNPHRTSLPPHLFRPWHATYTGDTAASDATPKVKYGTFIKKRSDADSLVNLLELQLPPGADGKTRARVREARRAGKVVRRMETAREGALDYRLGSGAAESLRSNNAAEEGEDGEQTFMGNRQMRGSSVLGAQKGSSSGMRAWTGLVEDRIQRAREAGFFKVTKGHGKPIPRDPQANNPHIETGELLMNRIVKRQGALPPWIELQNNLDAALNAFRSTLISTYTTNLVRTVISTNALHPLPPLHTIPDHDEAWEAREKKFHEENVKQINDLVRKMNAQAPNIVRRALITREMELDRIRGDFLRDKVWQEIKRRAEDVNVRTQASSGSSAALWETDGLSGLRNATRRSLSTIARPLTAFMGKGMTGGLRGSRESQQSGGEEGQTNSDSSTAPKPAALIFIAGLGLAGIVVFRRPVRNESLDVMPLRREAVVPDAVLASASSEHQSGPFRLIHVYIIEPIATFFRFLHLALLFGPVILTSPMLLVGKPERRRRSGKPVAEDEENWGAVWWYGFLVRQMERAGPSFIKLGQWAASRADLFPASLCDRMSKLHSNGDPHSIKHTRRVLEEAFGKPFDEVFEEFGVEPIGCGAIAQVYKAKLRPEMIVNADDEDALSTSVAIKVLHPRVRRTVRRDIAIMSVFANAFNALPGMEWLSLPEEVQVFGEMMNSQLDLRVEASNLDRFDANFRKRGRQVVFPRAIRLGGGQDESKEVLIEEYVDALPLKWFLRNGGGPYDDRIANIGLDAFLEMLLLDNWTHGDLHPGNIMVRFYKPTTNDFLGPLFERFSPSSESAKTIKPKTAQAQSSEELVHSLSAIAHDRDVWLERLDDLQAEGYLPQLIFIDAGLVTSLDDQNRRNFLDLFQAVAEFDGYKAGKLMVERCRSPEYVIDEETFALKIQHLVLSVKSKTFSLAKIKISDILTDVLTGVRQHHVKLEGDFVNTVISILLLEGIGRQLDPNMDLFKSALPILRQLGRQLGTREAISAVPKGNIWAMVKLWVWVEAREVAGEAGSLDSWIKYDRLFPNL